MSFLSRRPSRSGNRDSEAGRDTGYDDYDYAPDGYARGDEDDNWSANEYFSPEGIKGRRAAGHPANPGAADYDGAGYTGAGYTGAAYSGAGYDAGDSFQGGGGYGGYGTDEYATGAYDLPEGTDDERTDRGGRRRRDRGERGGRLRLRRDKGEDIWPDDGVSDEDYWASVAADRPLTTADAPVETGPAVSEPRGGTGRLGPAPGLIGDYQPAPSAGALRRSAPQRVATDLPPAAPPLPPTPSFSPSARPQDRSTDWGERTERIERVTASGYPDPRAGGRGPGYGGAQAGRDPGRTSGPWPAAAGRGGGGYAPARAAGPEDPLTSSAYSRSALPDADGRSYRTAARRSQAQAKLTEENQTFGAPVGYPGDRYPNDRYQPSQPSQPSQRPGGRSQTGEHPAARYGQSRADAQEPTMRYPVYGSPPAPDPAPAPSYTPAPSGQRGGNSGQVSLPGSSGGPSGQYPAQQPRQPQQAQAPRQPQQPPVPSGGNPYDSAVTGSYPYPGQPGYPPRQPPQPPAPAAPDQNARDDRRRRQPPADGTGAGYGAKRDGRY